MDLSGKCVGRTLLFLTELENVHAEPGELFRLYRPDLRKGEK
ncbi:hypothetical protein RHI9324_04673 [Rhizobium sp. CECT 9324]|nr:hypothetical protein RHI9324_04673 [Rhizobium sp. CECT 9324]